MQTSIREKPYLNFLLAVLSGLLCWLSWKLYPIFIFFAFVPILLIEKNLTDQKPKKEFWYFWMYGYQAVFIWNVLCTWWIYYASFAGMAFAVIVNSFLMTIPLVVFRITKKNLNEKYGYFAFVLYWICFEYFHINWDISWVWLNLGNVFAFTSEWVQWYEYTGTLGGTMWILLVNVWIFYAVKSTLMQNKIIFGIYALLSFILPLATSLLIYYQYEEQGKDIEIIVIQPNIDPYTEKFIDKGKFPSNQTQSQHFIRLAKEKITDSTAIIAFPEGSLQGWIEESAIPNNPNIQEFVKFKKDYPNMSFILGISSYKVYKSEAEASNNAFFKKNLGFYDIYNTALHIGDKDVFKLYHKSQLVVGVEKIPYYSLFKPLVPVFNALGGANGSMSGQQGREIFYTKNNIGIAPIICYESIFGEFVGDYVKNGANILCIITNDAWWENTDGHVQHFYYARLRAIETRKSIARSANTGISAFINQRGDILQRTQYLETAVLKETIKSNDIITYYTQNGDYIGRLSWFIAIGLFLTGLVKKIVQRNKKPSL